MEMIIDLIKTYLIERTKIIFRPIIDFFKEEQEVRTLSDLNLHLNKMMPSSFWEVASLAFCQWLMEQGYLERYSETVALTSRSYVRANEIAYIYTGVE